MTVLNALDRDDIDYKKIIEDGVKSVVSSKKWKDYLSFHTKFWKYSFHNTMLIYIQSPNATFVAGKKAWEQMGRKVKETEVDKYIKILAPSFVKRSFVEAGKIVKYDQLNDFTSVKVYDVSQTEGDALPSICSEIRSPEEEEKRALMFYTYLKEVIKIPVIEDEVKNGGNGFYHRIYKRIVIKKDMSYVMKFKTLIHEMTHSLLHFKSVVDDSEFRERAEIEAESVAFIVTNYFGFKTDEYSFEYLASWGDGQITKFSANWDVIQKTAKKIIAMIEEESERRVQ